MRERSKGLARKFIDQQREAGIFCDDGDDNDNDHEDDHLEDDHVEHVDDDDHEGTEFSPPASDGGGVQSNQDSFPSGQELESAPAGVGSEERRRLKLQVEEIADEYSQTRHGQRGRRGRGRGRNGPQGRSRGRGSNQMATTADRGERSAEDGSLTFQWFRGQLVFYIQKLKMFFLFLDKPSASLVSICSLSLCLSVSAYICLLYVYLPPSRFLYVSSLSLSMSLSLSLSRRPWNDLKDMLLQLLKWMVIHNENSYDFRKFEQDIENEAEELTQAAPNRSSPWKMQLIQKAKTRLLHSLRKLSRRNVYLWCVEDLSCRMLELLALTIFPPQAEARAS